MVDILIGGDVCPIGRNLPYFISGDAKSIFNELLNEFERADLSIANLECPLIKESSPTEKNGPILGVESECINALKVAGIDVLNLANNHIMDHGEEGLKNTLKVCGEARISTVGAGVNLKAARQMLMETVDDVRIGIIAVAEREFSIATENYWGANPLDLIDFVRNINEQQEEIDYLIVLLHGGNEHYPYPSPRLRDTCHFLVEMGAKAVIVQHTHCAGCFETYRGGHIIYGQGNFIFDKGPNKSDQWTKGFLVAISLNDLNKPSLNIIPYIQSAEKIGARKMLKDEEIRFLQEIEARSEKLSDKEFIERQWLNLCQEKKHHYYFNFLPGLINNRILSKINKHIPFIEKSYSKKHLLSLENNIRCESHREILETIFEERRKKERNNKKRT